MSAVSDPQVAARSTPEPKPAMTGLVVLAVVIALVSAALAGGVTYFVTSTLATPRMCANYGCLRGVSSGPIQTTLQSHGFTCAKDDRVSSSVSGYLTCAVEVRQRKYQLTIESASDGQVVSLIADVSVHNPGLTMNPEGKQFLQWVAGLANSSDPAAAGAVRTWLAQRLDSGKASQATLGAYRFRLDIPTDGSFKLAIHHS